MLIDRGLLEQVGDEYRPTGPIEALEVPETLQALIAARLDGLAAEERSVVQDAAVLGKTFTKSALAAVSGSDDGDLDTLLAALVRKEVLSLQVDPRSPERGQFSFLQDLLRQVAYETLSRRERKARHLAAAAHLEQQWQDGDEELVEIVAAHVLSALELDPEAGDASELRKRSRASSSARQNALRRWARARTPSATSSRRSSSQGVPCAAPSSTSGLGSWPESHAALTAPRAHFEQAIALFEEQQLTHPAARVTAWLGIVTWNSRVTSSGRSASWSERSRCWQMTNDDPDLATVAVQLARALYFSGQADDAMERNELALRSRSRSSYPTCSLTA